MDRRRIGVVASVMICGLFLLLLGPFNIFTHGFYPEEIDVEQIADIDKIGQINVDDENCAILFSPKNNLFAGFELFLVNQHPENGGTLIMSITNSQGSLIDEVEIDLSKVTDSKWYKVYTNAVLKKGSQYTADFSVTGTDSIPAFLLVSKDYLGDETINGNILVSYAYRQSTFTFQEKVLLFMLIIALLGVVLYSLIPNKKYGKTARIIVLFLVLTAGMTWNYMYNSFDNQNTSFSGFQSNSETLVTGTIFAERNGIYFLEESERGFGLGRYYDLKGTYTYSLSYTTDENWLNGYSRTTPAIIVNSNKITKSIAIAGNYIQFKNGEEYQITEITDDGTNIIINLNAERTLSSARNGSLDNTQFYDANHSPIAKSLITAYRSQYGLQGKVFRHLARHMTLTDLNLICSIATASVFVLIVLLLANKFNPLFAGCFYVVFALSPWVVNYARNLYWVEFSWFIPMAIGLICSMKIDSRKWRIGCYAATLISIAGKCLCGYEYISVVMMGLVSFVVIDLLLSIVKKEKEKAKLLFRTTFVLGVIALIGFMVAICIHAPLKSDGSIIEGIKKIIESDVLRRTNGADLNNFDPVYWPSMNASVWEVYCKYFHFSTEVITGVTGNLFPLLCIIPLVIFVYEFEKKKIEWQDIFMYGFFFLTSISWFCLAKSHSYIHTPLNFVLWYFGYIQTCFYVICSRIVAAFPKDKTEKPIDNMMAQNLNEH